MTQFVSILLTIIYILSLIFTLKFLKTAYSINGRWDNLKKSKQDYIVALCPYLNTLFVIIGYLWFPPHKKFY